MVYKNKY